MSSWQQVTGRAASSRQLLASGWKRALQALPQRGQHALDCQCFCCQITELIGAQQERVFSRATDGIQVRLPSLMRSVQIVSALDRIVGRIPAKFAAIEEADRRIRLVSP